MILILIDIDIDIDMNIKITNVKIPTAKVNPVVKTGQPTNPIQAINRQVCILRKRYYQKGVRSKEQNEEK